MVPKSVSQSWGRTNCKQSADVLPMPKSAADRSKQRLVNKQLIEVSITAATTTREEVGS